MSVRHRRKRRKGLAAGPDLVAAWATRLTAPLVAPLLEMKVLAAFLSASLVVLVAGAAFVEMRASRDLRGAVEFRHATIDTLMQIQNSLLEAESGQRGYLLTSDSRYLQSYRVALPRLDGLLVELQEQTAGDANQQGRLMRLRGVIADKRKELSETIELHATHHEQEASTVVVGNWGKQTMDQARELVAEMTAAEVNLMEVDLSLNEREQRRTDWVLALGSLGAFLLTILVNLAIRGDVAQRRDAHRLIEGQAAKLARINKELSDAQQALRLALGERESALSNLAASNRDLDQFAYVAAHDLKAPLRGIANLANWIEEDLGAAVTNTAREHLSLLRSRATRLEALINGILEYARAGRRQGGVEQVDLHSLVTEILELIAPPPERFAVRIEERLPTLSAPRIPLERIWTNLLSNAVKYGPPVGAIVTVSVREDGAFWQFTVADNGLGLAEKNHRRIFALFQRVETSEGTEGTGIGLAVVKRLVEGFGGKVWVESEPGNGSRFHFTWPKEAGSKSARQSDANQTA